MITKAYIGLVAPRAGAWIETTIFIVVFQGKPVSRPARARGLKQPGALDQPAALAVAPRAGAWIETWSICGKYLRMSVAPRAGAWIET